VDFRLLGPLEVYEDRQAIALGGPRQRALLAILLLNANDVLPSDELMHDLWTRLPETAGNTLQAHVSRLRKALGRSRIVTRGSGYMLRLDEGERDVERFEELAADGREALFAGNASDAGRLLRAALDLWRGPVLADLDAERFASAEVKRLEEERLAVLEDRIEADLATGLHAELVPELEQLTVEQGLRERLRGQLMLALYRSGRQADALHVYRKTRRTLVDELGIEPGPALRRLETGILLQEPWLEQLELGLIDIGTRPKTDFRDSRLVGREAELGHLLQIYESVKSRSSCHLVTLIGSPGIGKSRVAQELLSQIHPEAATAIARCAAHGEGSAFGPLAEVVQQIAGGTTARAIHLRLGHSDAASRIAERLSSLMLCEVAEWEDIQWAARRFLEIAAERQPLVVVFDDVQWGHGLLLDFIDYLTEWPEDIPLLLLCLARHDLLDLRPAWGGGKANAVSLTLEPLKESDAKKLLDALPGSHALNSEQRGKVLAFAEGNPLFIEEMAALAREGHHGELSVPSSIRALLATRLAHLTDDERVVLCRAAIVGREPSLKAIQALVGNGVADGGMPLLRQLVRRDFLRPTRVEGDEERFRFRHVLLRDAAYEALSAATRAPLHEQFGLWLETQPEQADAAEQAGHHLEKAYCLGRYQGEGDKRQALARRAAVLLAAGRDHEVGPTGIRERVDRLSRAVELLDPQEALRGQVSVDIGIDLEQLGDCEAARARYLEGLRLAETTGDDVLKVFTSLLLGLLRLRSEPSVSLDDALDETERALSDLALVDEGGKYLNRAQALLASVYLSAGHAAKSEELLVGLVENSTARSRVEYVSLRILFAAWMWGPRPAETAIPRYHRLLSGRLPLRVEASAYRYLAVLEGMRGNFNVARSYLERDRSILEDLGLHAAAAGMRVFEGAVELLADEPARAEDQLRDALTMLQGMSEKWYTSGLASMLGQVLYAQGRLDDASEMLELSDSIGSTDAIVPVWNAGTRAKIRARQGDRGAFGVAEEAVTLAKRTDHINEQAGALLDLGTSAMALGQDVVASRALATAAGLYTKKGNAVMASRAFALKRQCGA
jgi:DNA-binding SARP family transcriptional activator/tetratricopeptide (TPR) repeat protein